MQLGLANDRFAAESRNYRGDLALEAKFFKAITGEEMTQEKLDLAAERIFTLHRAYTVKLMQTKDMRNEHDLICSLGIRQGSADPGLY